MALAGTRDHHFLQQILNGNIADQRAVCAGYGECRGHTLLQEIQTITELVPFENGRDVASQGFADGRFGALRRQRRGLNPR